MTNNPESSEPGAPDDDTAADITGITVATPTTAEEAMDADGDGDGFANESAYTPANP